MRQAVFKLKKWQFLQVLLQKQQCNITPLMIVSSLSSHREANMSLVCWLPLADGTLTNNGAGNLTITESNTTNTTNGRIGRCRTFNGSTSYIALAGTDLYNCFKGGTQPFSICM